MSDDRTAEGLARKQGRGWRFYVVVAAAFLLAILIVQNAQKVTVDFFFVETETPLIIALAVAGLLGAVIGWAWPNIRRGRRAERELEQKKRG